ncbi:energy transducer TonB [Roseicella frigidaeris]|uniref:Energy transducer TonB n=1 Tax=Roseicella frigidaeris TaxID=2230885 RepID=A0A327M533_9PROT|nr:energy transducer TonB [Roseicella frigidaeris]RAI57343.1 energy transducer TonB [Roseicella frigidaeris]
MAAIGMALGAARDDARDDGPAPQQARGSGRNLAWIGSIALHLAAGAALIFIKPPPPLPPEQVITLEMPLAEDASPEPEALPEPVAAPVEPPPAEPPPMEPPPEPVAEPPPEPPPEPVPEQVVADLPAPPPMPPPPVPPRRPPTPRPVAQTPAPAAPAVASAPPVEAPAPTPAARVSAAAPSASYISRLFAALERHKSYPQEARLRRIQGIALLRFSMRRDGSVTAFRLLRSAGDPSLDEAVLAMIQRASPLPAPPDDLPGDPVELSVPIRFSLR